MKHLNFIKEAYQERPAFAAAVVFVILFSILSAFYFSASSVFSADDQFFHHKYSRLLRDEGLGIADDFKWVFFSEYDRENLRFETSLFHYILIPFSYIKDDIFKLKISAIVWASLMLSAIYYTLRKIRTPQPFLSVLFLLTAVPAIELYLSGRNYVLVPALILLELYFCVKNRRLALFFVVLFHIAWHRATFFMPISIALIVEVTRYLHMRRMFYKNLLAVGLASMLGTLFYSAPILGFVRLSKSILSIHSSEDLGEDVSKMVGAVELIPMKIRPLIENDNFFLLMFFVGLAVVVFISIRLIKNSKSKVRRNEEEKEVDLFLFSSFFVFLLVLLGLTLLSGRFYSFYFTCAIFSFSVAIKRICDSGEMKIGSNLKSYLILSLYVFVILFAGSALLKYKERSSIIDITIVKDAAEWINEKTEDEEVVFLENWSDFPALFSYNSDNYYSTGMEPKALYEYDPKLFWKWYNIAYNQYVCEEQGSCFQERKDALSKARDRGAIDVFNRKVARDIANSVRNDFRSRVIFSQDVKLNRILSGNKVLFEEIYKPKGDHSEKNNAMVFLIKQSSYER